MVHPGRLRVKIEGSDLSDDEMDRLTRQLWFELRDNTDAEGVDLLPAGSLPVGSKAGETVELGALAVQLMPVAIPGLVSILRHWADRHNRSVSKVVLKVEDRAVELEYPVGTMTREDLMHLVAVVTSPLPSHRRPGESPNREA
jgi:hypothetical protein